MSDEPEPEPDAKPQTMRDSKPLGIPDTPERIAKAVAATPPKKRR